MIKYKAENPIVIIANGEYPNHHIPLNVLINAKKIIACDGAVNLLDKNKIKPNFIIGDLDSISNKLKVKYKKNIISIPSQKNNDFSKALNFAIKNKYNKISILGASGLRDDHGIGNFFRLFEYSSSISLKMYTNYGIFHFINKKTQFPSFKGQQISIFAIDKTIKISSNKLKYNLKGLMLSSLFSGTLNESISDNFSINLTHGSIAIYQTYKRS